MLTEKWAATQSCSPGTASLGAVPPAFPEGDSVRSARLTQQTCFSPGRWHRGSWVRPAPGHGQG